MVPRRILPERVSGSRATVIASLNIAVVVRGEIPEQLRPRRIAQGTPLSLAAPWIVAVSALLANSAVGFVEHGLTKAASVSRLMTRLDSRLFSANLRPVR